MFFFDGIRVHKIVFAKIIDCFWVEWVWYRQYDYINFDKYNILYSVAWLAIKCWGNDVYYNIIKKESNINRLKGDFRFAKMRNNVNDFKIYLKLLVWCYFLRRKRVIFTIEMNSQLHCVIKWFNSVNNIWIKFGHNFWSTLVTMVVEL